jgi:hypothetical protein
MGIGVLPLLSQSKSRFRDEKRAALIGQPPPQPLSRDAKAALELRQKQQMDASPNEKRQESTHSEPSGLEQRKIAADDRHGALVKVPKRASPGAPFDSGAHELPDITTLLDGHLRNAR